MVLRTNTVLLVIGLGLLLSDCSSDTGQDTNIAGYGFPDYAYPLDGYRAYNYGDRNGWNYRRWDHGR
jgi:hypothetical protein